MQRLLLVAVVAVVSAVVAVVSPLKAEGAHGQRLRVVGREAQLRRLGVFHKKKTISMFSFQIFFFLKNDQN